MNQFLNEEADVNILCNSQTALMYGADAGETKFFHGISWIRPCILIKAGADVNIVDKRGNTALILAEFSARGTCVDLLIKAGAGVNIPENNTIFIDAAKASFGILTMRNRNEKCVELLLKAGAAVNTVVKTLVVKGVSIC